MTAFTDIKSVETRKAMYSQELAAYTRRQWDTVRRTMEDGSGSQTVNPPLQQESASAPPDSGTTSRLRNGIVGRLPPKIWADGLHQGSEPATMLRLATGTSTVNETWLLERRESF